MDASLPRRKPGSLLRQLRMDEEKEEEELWFELEDWAEFFDPDLREERITYSPGITRKKKKPGLWAAIVRLTLITLAIYAALLIVALLIVSLLRLAGAGL